MSNNPGLSDQAWKNLHRIAAKMQLKYGPKLAAEKQKGA